MKDRYAFPAILTAAPDGVSVEFPDLPGCLPCGDTIEEAIDNAKEAMALHIYGMEQDGEDIPEPTKIADLILSTGQISAVIDTWMIPFRDEMENKAVKKTLTIPKWLDDLATERKVNFSQVLQHALMLKLGVGPHRGMKLVQAPKADASMPKKSSFKPKY